MSLSQPARMVVLARGICEHNRFVSAVVTLVLERARGAASDCYLVRIHSTGATEGLLDAMLSRPSRDRVRYALIAAGAFEDGPGLCTVTRRDQYTEIELPALIEQIVEATNDIIGEDSTYYELV